MAPTTATKSAVEAEAARLAAKDPSVAAGPLTVTCPIAPTVAAGTRALCSLTAPGAEPASMAVWVTGVDPLAVRYGLLLGLDCPENHTPWVVDTARAGGYSFDGCEPAPSGPAGQVLAPATVPSSAGVCDEPLQTMQDGNQGPLFCADGAVNAAAWRSFAAAEAAVLAAGPSADADEVVSRMCAAWAGSTGPRLISAYQLAQRYYGWTFPDPSSRIYTDC